MQIKIVKINLIKPYDHNPRKNDKAVAKVAQSLKEFGFQQPLVVDKDFVLIAGHTRLLAARSLNFDTVPVLVAENLSTEQIKAYRIADNRTAQEAQWDVDLLKLEFLELQELGMDLTLTGFNNNEIDKIINSDIKLEEEFNLDELDGLKVNLGDIFILGEHRLMCGDSTDPLAVDKLLNTIQPHLMVTDPPYGVEYDASWREMKELGVGKRSKGKVLNDNKVDWSAAYALFPGDVAYVWHAGKYTATIAQNLLDLNYQLIAQIIWVKQHFVLSRGDYHWQHEPCWYAVKKGKKHQWQGSRDQKTVWMIENNNSWGNSNCEETVGHSTQKPIECMRRPILNNSKPGDYIYDPFGGSGTTLIAAEQLQRKCLIMELDPKYCKTIIRRWEKLTGKSAITDQL